MFAIHCSRVITIVLFCSTLSGCNSSIPVDAPATVAQVQLDRYMGKWYEIGHKPMKYQAQCVANITADYTLNPDNTVTVSNRCLTATGQTDQAMGTARSVSPDNAQLEVSFFGPFYAPYWIFWLDQSNQSDQQPYQMALVGSPNKQYLWLLSRTAQPNVARTKQALDYAVQIGFDLSDFQQQPHTTD